MSEINPVIGAIRLKRLSELVDKPKVIDKSKLTLTPKPKNANKKKTVEACRTSPRTRLRVKQELAAQCADIHPKAEISIVKRRTNRKRNQVATETKEVEKENQQQPQPQPLSPASAKSSSVEVVWPTPANKTVQRTAKTTSKKSKIPANQMRIDKFFMSSSKIHQTQKAEKKIPNKRINAQSTANKKSSNNQDAGVKARTQRGRKRLFAENSTNTPLTRCKKKTNEKNNNLKVLPASAVIDLCEQSETDEEQSSLCDFDLNTSRMHKMTKFSEKAESPETPPSKSILKNGFSTSSALKTSPKSKTVNKIESKPSSSNNSEENSLAQKSNYEPDTAKPTKACPPYKVVEGTTFAVDAFRYGEIANVTHYFLTHFHADHYTGLTRKFSMPLYLSAITARLVREFIGVNDIFLHELELNEPIVIEGIEVTAIDANHCPGAIMLIFKLPYGKCILHTGDFRACSEMESEPYFWNNDIDTVYLDTTYLPTQYAFCTQSESIDRGKSIIEEFQKRHHNKRILYICGSYVIGKEKFWSAIAREFRMRVWTENNRHKALQVMQLPELKELQYVEDPEDADLHIIPLGKLSYSALYEYFKPFSRVYDVMLALRPSGWEKNSRPRFSGQINVVGIEYSEHSSYNELERFVKYLKPRKVISTVPVGRNLFETAETPLRWYKYETLLPKSRNYQPTITSYLPPIRPIVSLQARKFQHPQIVERDTQATDVISPTKSTPLACIGSIHAHFTDQASEIDDSFH